MSGEIRTNDPYVERPSVICTGCPSLASTSLLGKPRYLPSMTGDRKLARRGCGRRENLAGGKMRCTASSGNALQYGRALADAGKEDKTSTTGRTS